MCAAAARAAEAQRPPLEPGPLPEGTRLLDCRLSLRCPEGRVCSGLLFARQGRSRGAQLPFHVSGLEELRAPLALRPGWRRPSVALSGAPGAPPAEIVAARCSAETGRSVVGRDAGVDWEFVGGALAKKQPLPPRAGAEPGLRIRLPKAAAKAHFVSVKSRTGVELVKGELLVAVLRLRAAPGSRGRAEIVFEGTAPPYRKSLAFEASLDGRWRDWVVPFRLLESYGAGAAQLGVRLGAAAQTVEIAESGVFRLPGAREAVSSVSYPGREPGAPWRARARAALRERRFGRLRVKLVDERGRPLEGARVRLAPVRPEFVFGTAVSARHMLQQDNDSSRYLEALRRGFDGAVLESDLKWPNWEEHAAQALEAAEAIAGLGLALRGHNLVWPGWGRMPRDARELEARALERRVLEHIEQEAGHPALRGSVSEWDVVNEPLEERDAIERLGGDAAMAPWFAQARASAPKAGLFVNETRLLSGEGAREPRLERFGALLRALIAAGAPIDGIGVQAHFGAELPGPEAVSGALDRLAAEFPRQRIVVSEYSVGVADERLQTDYLRDLATTAFAHRAVRGFYLWGFWDGRHWLDAAPLYGRDWREKPAGRWWRETVGGDWRSGAEARTGPDGLAVLEAPLGEARLEAESGGLRGVSAAVVGPGASFAQLVLR